MTDKRMRPPPHDDSADSSSAGPARSTIVMFSGGIDSTYTLVKLLRETDDALIVHHINFMNVENRHEIEGQRSRQIAEYCHRTYRPFLYTESTLDHRAFQFFGFDMIGVGFEAGLVAQSHLLRTGRMADRWTIGNCLEEGGNSERWKHVVACLSANCFPHTPPQYFNIPIVSKHQEVEYIPPTILDLTWTCRTPTFVGTVPHECGQCATCKLLKTLGVRGTGKSPEVPRLGTQVL